MSLLPPRLKRPTARAAAAVIRHAPTPENAEGGRPASVRWAQPHATTSFPGWLFMKCYRQQQVRYLQKKAARLGFQIVSA
jgi:hypothetical protein